MPDTSTLRSKRKHPRPISSVTATHASPTGSSPDRLAKAFLTAQSLDSPCVDSYTNILRRFLLTGALAGRPSTPKHVALALSNSPLHAANGVAVVGSEATPWITGIALVAELLEPLAQKHEYERTIRDACHASFVAEVIARVTLSRAPIRSWLATWLAFLVEIRSAIDARLSPGENRPTLRQLVVVLEQLGLYAALPLPDASKAGNSPWHVAAAAFNVSDEAANDVRIVGQALSNSFVPAQLPASSRLLLNERSKRMQVESDRFASTLIAGTRSRSSS